MTTPSRSKVLLVASEAFPFVKTGGLGDVMAALPSALRAVGVDARLLLPGYPGVLAGIGRARKVADGLLRGEAPNGVPCYAAVAPALFEREGNPYLGPDGRDWPDNHLRFGALCKAAAQWRDPAWRPDVVHGHDWQSGLVPAYLRFQGGRHPATVITIHNLAYQGLFPAAVLQELGLPPESFSIDGLEYWGKVGFLKAGLYYADRLTTVSPTYAREIQGPELGFGLEGLLAGRAGDLTGILNGVDYDVWDPATDRFLPHRYGPDCLEKKAANKAALQRELGLEPRTDAPLFVVVSRLTAQKGLDLVLDALRALSARGCQLAVLGSGDAALEAGFRAAAAATPGAVAVRLGYDEPLSHRLQGAGDAILVPSRFEPCGLTQMYALRYGTLPVVRRTGGLADTVEAGATGFTFDAPTPEALVAAVDRAAAIFADRPTWQRMQRRAMAQDFSWQASAKRYCGLYEGLRRSQGASAEVLPTSD